MKPTTDDDQGHEHNVLSNESKAGVGGQPHGAAEPISNPTPPQTLANSSSELSISRLLMKIQLLEAQNTALLDQLQLTGRGTEEEHDSKADVPTEPKEHDVETPWLIIHRVICDELHHPPGRLATHSNDHFTDDDESDFDDDLEDSGVGLRQAEYHASHSRETFFLDTPSLHSGDARTDPLRGEHQILDIERFLDSRGAKFPFVVYKDYSCIRFHNTTWTLRQRGPIARIDRKRTLLETTEPATFEAERLVLQSTRLQRGLKHIIKREPKAFFKWELPDELRAPYLELYEFRGYIRAEATEFKDKSKKDIELLLDYIESSYGDEYAEAKRLFGRARVTKKHLLKLFPPGETLVTETGGYPRAYECQYWPTVDEDSTVHVVCFCWTFDGVFRRQNLQISIKWPNPKFSEIKIQDLEFYPIEYGGFLHQRLDRIRYNWSKCCRRKFVQYEPPTWEKTYAATSQRFMIDYETYQRLHPEANDFHQLDSDILDPQKPSFQAEKLSLLLPYEILGFAIEEKRWKTILIEHVSEVEWNRDVFRTHLVINYQSIDVIHAFMTDESVQSPQGLAYPTRERGKGWVLLFHGPTGTGKTSAAEGIAEETHKPLYRVTSGDIGTDPEKAERNLQSILYLGKTWGCVILLDDADIFLQERNLADISRNALVSVILKALDTNESIFILTTNRFRVFDEAANSRIHFSIYFPSLNPDARKQTWLNASKAILSNDPIADKFMSDVNEHISELISLPLNGRQIWNSVRTSRQLAHRENKPLDIEHIKSVNQVIRNLDVQNMKTQF